MCFIFSQLREETIKFLRQIFRCKKNQDGGNQRNERQRNERQRNEEQRVSTVNTRVTTL